MCCVCIWRMQVCTGVVWYVCKSVVYVHEWYMPVWYMCTLHVVLYGVYMLCIYDVRRCVQVCVHVWCCRCVVMCVHVCGVCSICICGVFACHIVWSVKVCACMCVVCVCGMCMCGVCASCMLHHVVVVCAGLCGLQGNIPTSISVCPLVDFGTQAAPTACARAALLFRERTGVECCDPGGAVLVVSVPVAHQALTSCPPAHSALVRGSAGPGPAPRS